MLQSRLVQLLNGCDAARIEIHTIPVLEKSEEIQSVSGGEGAEGNTSPFRFTPHTIRLDKDDEFFEVCVCFSFFTG